jgi:hypothetical protein
VERVPSQHGDEGVDDQTHDQQHLAQREPELRLAVPFHGEEVDQRVAAEDDGDDRPCGHDIAPEMDNDVACHDFKRHQHGFEDEEIVSGCNAKGIVHVTARKADKGRGDG